MTNLFENSRLTELGSPRSGTRDAELERLD
jgi:hypothetical protein